MGVSADTGSVMGFWRATSSLLLLMAVVVLAAIFGSSSSIILERAVINALIMVVIVAGLYMFIGISGILSFGHIAFMAIGGYTSALLTIPEEAKAWVLPDLPGPLSGIELGFVPATLVAATLAGFAAFVVSFPVLRFDGVQAALVTLGVLIIVHEVAVNWDTFTKGASFLTGTPTDTTMPWAAGWAVVALIAAWAYQRSTHGRRLAASREDASAAAALGVNVVRERRIAFVLSAMVVAAGGSVWVHFVSGFTPESFYFSITFITIATLIIGGSRSLTGAVAGVAVVSTLSEVLRRVERGDLPLVSTSGFTELGLAAAIILILIVRPEGLMAGRDVDVPSMVALVRRGPRALLDVSVALRSIPSRIRRAVVRARRGGRESPPALPHDEAASSAAQDMHEPLEEPASAATRVRSWNTQDTTRR